MSETTPSRKAGLREGLTLGISISLAMIVCKTVERSLTPNLGAWPAFGVGVLAAVVVASIIAQLLWRFLPIRSPS